MSNSNMIICQNGHYFSSRKHGTICPYCGIETSTRERRETGLTDDRIEDGLFLEEQEPICGWLVCVAGPRRGKDYKVKVGKNFVGRGDDMDIQILGDNKISRRNHCIIVYDEKKNHFLLLPGDSNGLVYLEDEAVYVPQEIAEYQVIEMGESKFLFVPFCGEHYRWKD